MVSAALAGEASMIGVARARAVAQAADRAMRVRGEVTMGVWGGGFGYLVWYRGLVPMCVG